MPKNSTRREEGIDFTAFDRLIEEVNFPITKDEFVTDFGQSAVDRTNAPPITIDELFAGTGADTFESDLEIRQAILNLMPRESVGRQRYSDRAGSGPKEIPFQNGRCDESL